MLERSREFFLSLVFPSQCEVCGLALPPSPAPGVCEKCRSRIHWLKSPCCESCGRPLNTEGQKCAECLKETYHFDRAYACALYDGPMKELLHIYKFKGRKYLKKFFVNELKEFMDARMPHAQFDAVLPVPMDRQQENGRGFNQSELLSRGLAAALRVPHPSGDLTSTGLRASQHFLTKKERRQNVRGRFFVKVKNALNAKRVLLIDDILTTGQTASECARVLKEAGAASVTVLALARGA